MRTNAPLRAVPLAAAVLITALATVGCGREVRFEDSFSRSLTAVGRAPYALGTAVTIRSHWSDFASIDHWTARSADPGVLAVGAVSATGGVNTLAVSAVATGEGATRFVIVADGREVGSVPVSVARVASIQLLDRTLQRAAATNDDLGDELRVVAGGTAYVDLRYLATDGTALAGAGLLAVGPTDGLAVSTATDATGVTTECLSLGPAAAGSWSVPVSVGADPVRTLTVVAVPATDVTSLVVLPPLEAGKASAQDVCAGAVTRDAAGRRVLGASAAWSLGLAEIAEGDLLCYAYEPSASPQTITVSVGSRGGQVVAHGQSFYSGAAPTLGCSASPGSASDAGMLVLLLLLGALTRWGLHRG
jgi:hypothetical protein